MERVISDAVRIGFRVADDDVVQKLDFDDLAASRKTRVTRISAVLGVGSPEEWLCATIKEEARCLVAHQEYAFAASISDERETLLVALTRFTEAEHISLNQKDECKC